MAGFDSQTGSRSAQNSAPLSPAQQRLWFFEQVASQPAVYHVPAQFDVHGVLDIAVFRRCLATLMRRHQPLRAYVTASDGEPRQVVMAADAVPVPLAWHDLRGLDGQAQAARTDELVTTAACARFGLGTPPLWRARILSFSDERHRLVLTLHHLIVDGDSLMVLMHELTTLYDAYLRGRPSPLPALPAEFLDAVQAQRDALDSGLPAEQLAYWRDRLHDAPPMLELPADYARPAAASYRGDAVDIRLSQDMSDGIRRLARDLRTTPYVVLLSVYASLLHRYTARTDLLIGTPVSGRTRPEWEQTVGCFTDTLVLRVDLSGQPRFVEIVDRVRTTVLSALDHRDVPFELLVAQLAPDRTTSHHPLFQVLFASTRVRARWEAAGLSIRMLSAIRTGTSKFDLALTWYESEDEVSGALHYASDLFMRATAERMAQHLATLIRSVLTDSRAPVSRLSLIPSQERAKLLADSQGGPAGSPATAVHLLVADQARQRPDAVAVSDGRRHVTYRELVDQAGRLADRLGQDGAGPGALVAVCLPRGIDLVVAELGIMAAGAAFLPLDPVSPPARLAGMLRDARPYAVVTSDRHSEPLRDACARLLALDAPPAGSRSDSTSDTWPRVDLDELAYIIYTSGSTGSPKGVMISHRSMSNLVTGCRDRIRLVPGDRCAATIQPAFDGSVDDIWPALAAGATLCVMPEQVNGSPREIRDWALDERITVVHVVVPIGELLMDLPWPASASIRLLHMGGDTLHRRPDPMLPFQVYNHYGPTESTVIASTAAVPPGEGAPPIGRPMPGIETYVLDGRMEPLPVGVPGELYLGGTGLARGYLGRPDLTADRFVPHPWRDGRRLYRTGDVVRWRSDGQIDFLGRDDRQVKVRGYRIEPAEVEAALATHPAVRESVVTVAGGRLVAHVGGRAVEPDELRAHLSGRVPGYMVPALFTISAELAKTAGGKIDHGALPAPAPATDASFQSPRTEIERGLARLWEEVLGVERVGVHDNFFQVGGNSMALARVQARLAETGAAHVPLVVLYEHSTIADLSRYLGRTTRRGAVSAPDLARADGARAGAGARLARMRQLRRSDRAGSDS